MRGLTLTWAIWCNGNTPTIRVEQGWGQFLSRKPAITPKRCEIGPRLLRHSNLLTLVLSCTVSEILQGFFCSVDSHSYSTLFLGVFPLDQIAHVGVNVSRYRTLSYSAVKLIIFEVFQPV